MATEAVMPRSLRRAFITPEGVDLRLELGSAGSRAEAFMIDLVLMVIILVAMTLAIMYLVYASGAGAAKGSEQFLAVLWLIGFFVLRNGWFALFEMGSRGATPGKRLLGLRVVARDGARLTGAAVIARNAMREIEVFLPLSFLGAQAAEGLADTFLIIFSLLWSGIFLFFPLFNRDRLRIGDLVGSIMPRTLRHMLSQPAFDIGNTVTGQRRDHERLREPCACIGRPGNLKQRGLLHEIYLVDEQDLGPANCNQAVEDRICLFVEAAFGVDQDGRDVGIIHPRPGARHHCPIEPALGWKNSRRIDEDELRTVDDRDPTQRGARCLRFMGDNGDLGSDQRIDQGRFADVRCADQRDESAAYLCGRPRRRNALAALPLRRSSGGARAFRVRGDRF